MCHGFEEGIVSAIMFEKIFLGFVFKIDSLRAGEVTQWVRAIAAKPDGLSSGSETHGGEGENQLCRLSSHFPWHTCVPLPTYTVNS